MMNLMKTYFPQLLLKIQKEKQRMYGLFTNTNNLKMPKYYPD